jgi:hypothetical protein
MRKMIVVGAAALAASLSAVAAVQNAATPQAQPSPATPAPAGGGLSDLEGLTKSCSMAALNAAARQAAGAPSQGRYQFSYFNLISDSHHARYEVHFTSNYEGEPALKYCVEIYCQQGWDPRTAKAAITEMSAAPRRGAAATAHRTACDQTHTPAKGRTRR